MAINKVLIIAFVIVTLLAVMVGSGVADMNDPYADQVISFTQGYVWDTTKADPPGTWGWTDDPEAALGGPTRGMSDGTAYFVSLGSRPAGEIVLKFIDSVLVDDQENAGFDLAIYEFGAADDGYVYLANDRNEDGLPDTWVYLGYTESDASMSRQTGSHPDYITGDSSSTLFLFDVAGVLDEIGGWASFIRIIDDDTGRKDPNFTDGFDLNAVELLNWAFLDDVFLPEEEPMPEEPEITPEEEETGSDEDIIQPVDYCDGCDNNNCTNKCPSNCSKPAYEKPATPCSSCSQTYKNNSSCSKCGQSSTTSGCSYCGQYTQKTGWWKYGWGASFKNFFAWKF